MKKRYNSSFKEDRSNHFAFVSGDISGIQMTIHPEFVTGFGEPTVSFQNGLIYRYRLQQLEDFITALMVIHGKMKDLHKNRPIMENQENVRPVVYGTSIIFDEAPNISDDYDENQVEERHDEDFF